MARRAPDHYRYSGVFSAHDMDTSILPTVVQARIRGSERPMRVLVGPPMPGWMAGRSGQPLLTAMLELTLARALKTRYRRGGRWWPQRDGEEYASPARQNGANN
jgi:hypothetical protein